ncbi:hypothetical protein ABH915_001046 [Arthrobacter sp. MW3 TE3886]
MTTRTLLSGPWRACAVALLSISLMSVTACSGGSTPPPGSPPTASQNPAGSPTPSATPTPTASYKPADATGKARNVPVPELPEAAKAETKEGAMAFASYWFSLLSYGYESGDLKILGTVTSSACEPCEKAKDVIQAWHSEGRWLVGGKISTPSISTEFTKSAEATYQVVVQAHQTPLTYVRADGSIARRDPQPDDTGNLLFVAFKNGAWSLVDVGRIVA